jgi:hypothetical protein
MVLSIGPDVYSTFQFVLSPEPEPPEMDPEPGEMEPEPPELEPPEMMMVTESEMLVPEPPEIEPDQEMEPEPVSKPETKEPKMAPEMKPPEPRAMRLVASGLSSSSIQMECLVV